MKIKSYAAYNPEEKLREFVYEDELEPNDILIKIRYCSVGTGDVKFINNYWNDTNYPIVMGHEMVGTVEAFGSKVKSFKTGDIVGCGYQLNSCNKCKHCETDHENHCLDQELIGTHRYGGFADKIIVNKRFTFKLPPNLDIKYASPLLCSGATVYSASKEFNIGTDSNVLVVGIGGLGHLAVKILRNKGCRITACTKQKENIDFIRKIGADEVLIKNDLKKIDGKRFDRKYDFVISTVDSFINLDPFLAMLKPSGTLICLGSPINSQISIPKLNDLAERSITGIYIAPPKTIKEFLEYSAIHKIYPEVEFYSIDDINQALKEVKNKKVRYKAVLEI